MSKEKLFNYIAVPLADALFFFVILLFSNLVLEEFSWATLGRAFYLGIALIAVFKVLFHASLGTYRLIWRYSIKYNNIKVVLFSILIDVCLLGVSFIPFFDQKIQFSYVVAIVSAGFDIIYLLGSRLLMWLVYDRYYNLKKRGVEANKNKVRTLIIGAGDAGSMILREIGEDKALQYQIVGFVDDSNEKIGRQINGIKIYGPIENINSIIKERKATHVIVAMPSAGRERAKEVLNLIDYKGVEVEIAPNKEKYLKKDLFSGIKKVDIADLLGRDQVELDKDKLNEFLNNKTILVTGGGGSIGSEIVRQVLEYHPHLVIIFDIYENTTYELKTELDFKYKNVEEKPHYIALIGSVRDEARLEEVFSTYKPDIIFHAAAHKHVPLMEDSPFETIKNNIKGTYNVAKMADKYHAMKMVLISTDKAVRPTNVMGASKRFCEMVVEARNAKSEHTKYSMVRFGNVLGSHGSVIPLFKSQIKNGGPVTVTSDKITRFFMTIPEACGLVIESGAYASGGEKFILDMGEPVKIIDLAKNLIKLSGLELGKDIDIEITGLRPGEKLYEELLLETANAQKTQNDKIYVEYADHPFNLEQIEKIIAHLESIGHDNKAMLDYLKEIEIIKVKD